MIIVFLLVMLAIFFSVKYQARIFDVPETVLTEESVPTADIISLEDVPLNTNEAVIEEEVGEVENEQDLPSTSVATEPVVIAVTPTNSVAPTPPVSPPVQAKQTSQERGFGMSVANILPGLSEQELNRRLDDMVSLGVTWIRLDFNWSVLQPKADKEPDWSTIDKVVIAAKARNLNLLPILVYTPTWARQSDCAGSYRCPPRNADEYATFAQKAVTRYAPLGIKHWEMWNEPNMQGSWLHDAEPYEYTVILKRAYVAIKEADPNAQVITAGLGPIETKNGNMQMLEYLEQMYQSGAQGYFDAVAIHPYSYPVPPTYDQSWNAWQQMNDTAKSVRSIMTEYGDGDKKIWITEYGAPTGGPGTSADDEEDWRSYRPTHVTEEYQKEILLDAISAYEDIDWAGPLFWYSYKDIGTSSDTIENFFGIIRFDGSHKPAYDALKKELGR